MSPIFGHFSESLTGLLTLRAFRKQPFFSKRNHEKLDHSNRVYWLIQNVSAFTIQYLPSKKLAACFTFRHWSLELYLSDRP